jgi:hypothetical protein
MFGRLMILRYVYFLSITAAVCSFTLLYVTIFCVIYPKTGIGLIMSAFYVLIFKLGIAEVLGPCVGILLRGLDGNKSK